MGHIQAREFITIDARAPVKALLIPAVLVQLQNTGS